MLEDRYYMRAATFRPRRSATLTLIIISAVVFFVEAIIVRFTAFPVSDHFALSLGGLKRGFVWQFLTYQFMHDGLLHLVFNIWAIYVFGNEVEQAIGRRSLVTLYLASGVIGGFFQVTAGLLLGGAFGAAVVGASAAAFGLATAFALLFPDRLLLLFFILPLRAKYLLAIMGALTLYGLMFPAGRIAHAAHLGGILTGLFFVRSAIHWNWRMPRLKFSQRAPTLSRTPPRSASHWSTSPKAEADDLPDEEFLSQQVDPILDKISASGIQSLTERERRILDKARAKMARR